MPAVLTRCVVAMALAGSACAGWAGDRMDATVLAGPCAACHGPDGRSPGAIPSLAGQNEDDLRARMRAFRDGTAPATVMTRLMKGYSEDEIAALAHWFAENAR
ncbi:c-type cytochrome [Paenirhodobacter sp.]|uniref:c-type cytochrome n=1 Tax=Paenirhodobacter sp. TaxID=1965326 RepID=UPI003B3CED59